MVTSEVKGTVWNRICEEDIKAYIREQLEDIIFILGLRVSARLTRSYAVDLIKEEVNKL